MINGKELRVKLWWENLKYGAQMEDLIIDGRVKTGFKGAVVVLRLNSRQDKRLFLSKTCNRLRATPFSRLMCPSGIYCGVQTVGA